MNHMRTGPLFLWALFVFSTSTLLAQDEGSVTEIVDRLVKAQDAPDVRVEKGLKCLQMLQDRPDPVMEKDIHLAIGLALGELERYRDARDHFKSAERLARQWDDKSCLAHCLWQRSLMAFRLGHADEAIAASTEGMAVAEPIGRFDILWRSANILGLTLERTGDYDAALDAFSRGLDAAERAKERAGLSAHLGNIGLAQMNLGRYEQALEFFERSLNTEREGGTKFGLSTALANCGDVHYMLNDLDKAIEYHEEALKLRKELAIESEISRSYHSMGAINFAREDFESALHDLERALEIRVRLDMAPEQAETLLAMAFCLRGSRSRRGSRRLDRKQHRSRRATQSQRTEGGDPRVPCARTRRAGQPRQGDRNLARSGRHRARTAVVEDEPKPGQIPGRTGGEGQGA